MKRWIFLLMILGGVLVFITPAFAQTTQVDALIEKLVDKGVLTKNEAIKLKGEIAVDEKIVREETFKTGLPEWVRKMKLKGDLRVRYQYERRKNSDDARARGRVRYRLGIETDIAKDVKIGAGLASGGTDPRSTNQTFENSFETPDIRLDYAFGQWNFIKDGIVKDAKVIAGRFPFKDYLWLATDMLWDGDITPTGGSFALNHDFSKNTGGFFNTGIWVIDENDAVDRDDPYLTFYQGGVKFKEGMFDAKAAGTYYAFNDLKGTCPNWSRATNTGIVTSSSTTGACTVGALVFDYDSVGAAAEVGVAKLFGGLPFGIDDRIAVFGDFIHNPDPQAENNGWSFGTTFGKSKLGTPGDWQMKYTRTILEEDSWPDFLPDSDRLGGRTNIQAHEVALEYLWKENVVLGIDFYNSDSLTGPSNPERLVQGDVNFKF